MRNMPNMAGGRPNDTRGFVHRKIGGAIKGFITGAVTTGSPLGALAGAGRGFVGGGATSPAPFTTPVSRAPGPCATGFARDRNGNCVPLAPITQVPGFTGVVQRVLPGGKTGFVDFGDAVKGQYGVALEPGVASATRRVCPRGTVLGNDGLCYNRRDLRNSERAWPVGRKPLLTGGDMRAIAVAASAARKLETKTKQLQSLGLLKKPMPRRRRKALPAHHEHSDHN